MGKPFITYTVPTAWASDANYAAGSYDWSSQPTKVVFPSYNTGFVPDQGAGPEYVNKLFADVHQSLADGKTSMQSLYSYVGNESALNWSPEIVQWRVLASGGTHMGCQGIVCAESGLQRWFAVTCDASNFRVRFASAADPAGAWTDLGFVTLPGSCYVTCPVAHSSPFVLTMVGSAGAQAKFVKTAGGAPTLITPASLSAAGAIGICNPKSVTFFNGLCIFFTILGTDAATIVTTPDASTFTKYSYALGTLLRGTNWVCASSASVCVAMGSNFGGNTANQIIYSSDGASWSQGTISPTTGAGEDPRAMTYSADTGLFTLITSNPSTPTIHYVYQSSNGTSWSYVSTFTLSGFGATTPVNDLAACGTLLVATIPTGVNSSRIVFSPDGGTSWYYKYDVLDEPNDSAGNGPSTSILGRIIASGDRFVIVTETGLRVSLRAGIGGTTQL